MKSINTFFAIASLSIFSINGYAGGGEMPIEPREPIFDMPQTEIEFEGAPFLFLNGGGTIFSVDSSKEPRSRFDNSSFADKGGIIEIGVGYNFNKNLFSTLAYQAILFDESQMNNFYASINYKFDDDDLMNLYVGAIFGVSTLSWDKNIHLVLIDKDLKSESLMYGLQVGASKEIQENLSITAKYQVLKYTHELDIRQNRSNVEYSFGQNILTGVQYDF